MMTHEFNESTQHCRQALLLGYGAPASFESGQTLCSAEGQAQGFARRLILAPPSAARLHGVEHDRKAGLIRDVVAPSSNTRSLMDDRNWCAQLPSSVAFGLTCVNRNIELPFSHRR